MPCTPTRWRGSGMRPCLTSLQTVFRLIPRREATSDMVIEGLVSMVLTDRGWSAQRFPALAAPPPNSRSSLLLDDVPVVTVLRIDPRNLGFRGLPVALPEFLVLLLDEGINLIREIDQILRGDVAFDKGHI